MSRPRFLADHDLNEPIVDGVLRQEPTVDVVRAREVGVDGLSDDDVLAYAAEHGRIVISTTSTRCRQPPTLGWGVGISCRDS